MDRVDRLVEPAAEPARDDELMRDSRGFLVLDESSYALAQVGAVLIWVAHDGHTLRRSSAISAPSM